VADDFERIVGEVREKLAALEVPDLPDRLIYSADEEVVEEYSQGFTRAGQALEAIRSPTTRRSEYEHAEGGESARAQVAVPSARSAGELSAGVALRSSPE
jgi:hypothetical protein